MTLEKKYTDIMSRVTSELIKDPLCKDIFYEPRKKFSDPKTDFPMDLNTVKKNIKSNSYIGFKQWIDDINLIWDNTISKYGEDSLYGGIAIYYKNKFKKTIDEIKCYNDRNFEERLTSLTKKFFDLLSNPPKILGITESFTPWPKDYDVFTTQYLTELTSFTKELVEKNNTEKLIEIIKENNPELIGENNIDLDIGKLNRKTILEIQKLRN